jgi:serine/threonine-protein kinase/endoribonuclease IRE1
MLKNYHASADREISLLIESDGHPNVVRYFFKEIRGDFVYLALEMCDASLQDLILSVQRKMCIQAYEPQVLAFVTRKVLFHIALGVKHLHELRIVHRDLKPQVSEDRVNNIEPHLIIKHSQKITPNLRIYF